MRASERHSLPHQDTLLSALVADRCGGNGDRTWIDAVNKAARQAFAVSMQGGALLAEKDGVVISKPAATTAAPPLSWSPEPPSACCSAQAEPQSAPASWMRRCSRRGVRCCAVSASAGVGGGGASSNSHGPLGGAGSGAGAGGIQLGTVASTPPVTVNAVTASSHQYERRSQLDNVVESYDIDALVRDAARLRLGGDSSGTTDTRAVSQTAIACLYRVRRAVDRVAAMEARLEQ